MSLAVYIIRQGKKDSKRKKGSILSPGAGRRVAYRVTCSHMRFRLDGTDYFKTQVLSRALGST